LCFGNAVDAINAPNYEAPIIKAINSSLPIFVGFKHRDETIFPDPDNFIPERWLNDMSRDLEKWLMAFSKGLRSCLGSK
jgi:cytochrome P450